MEIAAGTGEKLAGGIEIDIIDDRGMPGETMAQFAGKIPRSQHAVGTATDSDGLCRMQAQSLHRIVMMMEAGEDMAIVIGADDGAGIAGDEQ